MFSICFVLVLCDFNFMGGANKRYNMVSKSTCVLDYVGRVAVLRMVKGENRVNYEFMKNITELLDEVEKYEKIPHKYVKFQWHSSLETTLPEHW